MYELGSTSSFASVGMAYLDLRTRQGLHAKLIRRRLFAPGPESPADSFPCSDGGFLDACSAIVAMKWECTFACGGVCAGSC